MAYWSLCEAECLIGRSVASLQDTFAFMLTAGDIMDNYFPGRVKRILIVNAPFWFAGVWQGVAALLPRSISDKVFCFRRRLTLLHETCSCFNRKS